MRYRFYTVDVFSDQIFGGNQLAVFPDGRGLSGAQMQAIAREFNYSETTFVLPPATERGTRRVRIFTPGSEVPFAGHPTIGTAFVLVATGDVSATANETRLVLEEEVGPVPVLVRGEGGRPISAQLTAAKLPEFGPQPPGAAELAALLSLQPADIMQGTYAPQAVSCGIPFLFVPLAGMDAVRRARLSHDQWLQTLGSYWAPEVFIFSFETAQPGRNLHARMFAPRLGVPEDPATGSAASALAGYLAVRDARREGTLRWTAEQGFEMGRPSILEIEADKQGGEIRAVRVAGAAVLVSEGTMEVPDA